MCGGTTIRSAPGMATLGLSPRVRGNPKEHLRGRPDCGSIPACAGEPWTQSPSDRAGRVYPRVCGGTRSLRTVSAMRRGLSPRVRGNHPRLLQLRRHVGSIPACAGEPTPPSSPRRWAQVYPRVCGGTGTSVAEQRRRSGLSPRVRGNHLKASAAFGFPGSIPACAGEPATQSPTPTTRGVYPRVCGGTRHAWRTACRTSGLSPRVRGNPRRPLQDVGELGLSPRVRGNRDRQRHAP